MLPDMVGTGWYRLVQAGTDWYRLVQRALLPIPSLHSIPNDYVAVVPTDNSLVGSLIRQRP